MRQILLSTCFFLLFFSSIFAQLPANMFADISHAPFLQGVASGDPLPDRVIIWSRIEPDSSSQASATVFWEIALDSTFNQIIQNGSLMTDASKDWTLKKDVTGLSPYKTYYYRFRDNRMRYSVVGRTKTAPTGNSNQHVRLAVASCSSVYSGFFNAYRRIAERSDLDLMIHLGDYIYDFVDADERVRVPSPYPTVPATLQEWRNRHVYYLLDPDLRAARQQHPWISIWDNHDLDKGGPSYMESIQAYWEYLPIRQPNPNDIQQIYRRFSYGDMIDLVMIDMYLWRDMDTMLGSTAPSVLGNTQNQWLLNELQGSTAKWKLVGNQKMMGGWSVAGFPAWFPLGNGSVLDPGSWDGYDAERDSILNFVQNNNITNLVVLSGDAHVSMAMDLCPDPYDPLRYNRTNGQGSYAVEFLPSSISRGNLDEMGITGIFLGIIESSSSAANPNHVFSNLTKHGYGLLDIKPDSIVAEFWYSNILSQTASESFQTGMIVRDGEQRWSRVRNTSPMPPKSTATIISRQELLENDKTQIWVIYPNPSASGIFNLESISNVNVFNKPLEFQLFTNDGRLLRKWKSEPNIATTTVDISYFPNGIYRLEIVAGDKQQVTSLVKQ